MWSLGVVPVHPLSDDGLDLLNGFEIMKPNALLLHGSEQSLDHAVLLRCMWCDELLFDAIAAHRHREAARGKNQPVV